MDHVDTAADHGAMAVRLLEQTTEPFTGADSTRAAVIATAQVYATLAVASATAACWQELQRLRGDHHPGRR